MAAIEKLEIPSVQDRVSPEEWEQRVNLAALYRLVAHHHWDDMVFTHISVRVPGPEHHFLINPYGMMFEEITASSLVKIDTDGNIVEESPFFVNPAGFTIHSALHMAREDAKCVIHLHSDDGVAVSSQKHGLLPASQLAMGVTCDLAYHDYEGVALDLDERDRLVADMGDKGFMILRNHGTLTVGESCADAWMRMYFLERACTIQVRALSAGGVEALNPASAEAISKAGDQQAPAFNGWGGKLTWPALLRWLDRRDPSYRD